MSAGAGRLALKDGLRVASVGLRARRMRAALSALGIAIGTAAIVAVLGLSASSQAGLIAEIDQLGTNLLTVEAGQSFTGGAGAAAPRGPGADHPSGERPAAGTHRPGQGSEGLPELDGPRGQQRRPAGARHEPEPAVGPGHRRRTRGLAQRRHGPRAGRGARRCRRPATRHRPRCTRTSGSGWDTSGSTSQASWSPRPWRPTSTTAPWSAIAPPSSSSATSAWSTVCRQQGRRARSTCAPPPATRPRCSRCSRRPPTLRHRTR